MGLTDTTQGDYSLNHIKQIYMETFNKESANVLWIVSIQYTKGMDKYSHILNVIIITGCWGII